MYAHPKLLRHWARHHKPQATCAQIAQAALMRQAKATKREYLKSQGRLF